MRFSTLCTLGSAALAQAAVYQGFNYGSTFTDGSVKVQQNFEDEFNRAKNLQGTSGFTSARLYTMIQGGTANTVISAIPAAISTKTTLLLGMWASAGQANFDNELTALTNAINQYGTAFTDLIAGISVGSEDLYRVSPTGIENNSGAGSTPDQLVSYINQVRNAIKGTAAASASVGHVDTWTAWVNGSNSAVTQAVDWLGMDGYPYFQTTQSNGIGNGPSLFFDSYNATVGASQGKPVWITETGWPVSGPLSGQAVASVDNAETYWQDVACRVLGNINTFWYTLQDAYPTTPAPSFGIVGTDLNSAPLYNLTCSNGNKQSSSSPASSSTAAVSSSVASPTKPTTAAASGTVSIVTTPESDTASATSISSPASHSASSQGGASTSLPAGSYGSSSAVTTSTVITTGGQTHTMYSTTLVTITSCSSECKTVTGTTPAAPNTATASGSAAKSASASASASASKSATGATSPLASPSSSGCTTNILSGSYEYPHLIVPVDSSNPTKAEGTSYNGTISNTISSIFNFDIPTSYAGKTCSLVFLFPTQAALETSSFTFNGKGGIKVSELSAVATAGTTYNTVPAASGLSQTLPSVAPGNSYTLFSHQCAAGQAVAFEFSSVGGLELNYFQDYNPSPIGAFISVC